MAFYAHIENEEIYEPKSLRVNEQQHHELEAFLYDVEII